MTLEDAIVIQIECDRAGGMFKIDPSLWPDIEKAREILYKEYGENFRERVWSTLQ